MEDFILSNFNGKEGFLIEHLKEKFNGQEKQENDQRIFFKGALDGVT